MMSNMPSRPEEMSAAAVDSMESRTGRTLSGWSALVESESGLDPLDQKAVRAWLRDVHGVPQNSQWAIAFDVAARAGWVMPSADQFADALFSGRKAALRPLHDAVVATAAALGADTSVEGRATYTPVVRRTQFVAVAPGPRGTLRVGLRFRRDPPGDERLSPARGFAQATHWLHLPGDSSPDAAASGLRELLRAAYEQNG